MWWWRWQGCGGGGGGDVSGGGGGRDVGCGGGGGGRDVVVEVVAGCGGGGVEEEPRRGLCLCGETWEHVCVVKRSRGPFLMKGLRENKQSAASKRLPASERRRHKWPEVLLAKKQTEP
ncbi:hypothetical protein Hanom_Chr11g01048471 [Helianthus anomalus]